MKKHVIVRMTALFLCLLIFFSTSLLGINAAAPNLPDLRDAKAVVLYHVESNSTVLASNENTQLPAASTVKVLSGLLLCEILRDRLSESVVITSEMLAKAFQSPLMGLQTGNSYTVEYLLYMAICCGYNDAFYALACVASQSIDAFVARMNQRAHEIGLTVSLFTDPTETPDSSRTTAAEMAMLASVAYQNDLYMQICGTKQYAGVKNINEMIGAKSTNKHYNSKCNGMSAGWSTAGGDCVVASVSNGSDSYICVVLGCTLSKSEENNLAYMLANRLIYWVYETYQNVEILTPDTIICKIPVTVSDMTAEVEVKVLESVYAYLPITAEVGKEITYSIRLTQNELEAPVSEGTFVGYVAILYGGEILQTVPLYTAGSAERSSFISRLKEIRGLFENRPLIAGLVFFLVGLTAWITFEILYKHHQHKRWKKYFSQKVDTTRRK